MLTRKEALWLACREKTCCHASVVIPTGRDVWRVSRALDTPPWTFLLYFPAPYPRRDAFVLDQDGPPLCIALGKASSRRKVPPCIFLLGTRQGHHRCGLADLRPSVCRTLHAQLADGVLHLSSDGRCTCRSWSLADVDIADETALVEARQHDAAEYCAIVGCWNERVTRAPAGATFSFEDFCRYLLESYDALAADAPAAVGSSLIEALVS